ncbi:phage tail assembly chaperone G [Morganella morganii]|uniref:phage tail assembly chaperone G n=1 Tax=Morganella morganii TaxID=582 RepID=UPI001404A4AF|nr:phage minor tail protein G [Morganella morganii]MBS9572357.1 phage minor tail protein G [Morganella morganii subsp. morganii]MBT0499590.1 phage minor tail protein G [Morganella morganii subsp. morganii]QIM76133.1 phage minor tail protein G [Morganella morganii subsp. morganii]QWL98482.1 phage minor tail protein G [Morganella morganii subsp. morganii]HDT4953733.1 phage minor tail protein G [Morganella morganii subsp. morganii]
MMNFLKQKEFTYNGESLMLSELSALQRVEYFDHLVIQTEKEAPAEDAQSLKRTAVYVRMNIESNAFLVARSLFNVGNTPGKQVDEIRADILSTWPPVALEQAAKLVLELSDMQVKTTDGESAEPVADPESAEK